MDCPSDAELQDLSNGADDEARVAHLRSCTQCQARLASGVGLRTTMLRAPQQPLDGTLQSDRTLTRELGVEGALAEGTAVGPYVVSKRLGAGAMGAVHAAWDPRLEREVALKVLHLEGDLLDEARLLAKLSHPNVVAVHEVFTWQERAVLVMERVRGASLREWLQREPRSVMAIVDVFTQCAHGLAAAHAAGVIHRDFKPDNVLVDETGRARLVDFGLAMRAVQASGGLAGSPAYMPLAQLEGAPADERSDQFSWWASLYEALCRRLPAEARSIAELIEARRRPPPLERVPRRLRKAMARGLSNDPALRFGSIREAAAAIHPGRPLAVAAAAVVVLVGTMGVLATRTPNPCAALTVEATSLSQRTRDPVLLAEISRYAEEQQRCSALPAEARTRRAQCLEQVGQELDIALAALEGLSIVPPSPPRVLRRVRPAARCATQPIPPVELVSAEERPAYVASLQAFLRFDALRISGDMQGAYELVHRHLRGLDANAPAGVLAWARLLEGSALSLVGRSPEALEHYRAFEGQKGVGLRQRTFNALARWLHECGQTMGPQCTVARQQAQSLASELDEPWPRAVETEVAALTTNDVVSAIEAWKRVPGASFEVENALANFAYGVRFDDDLGRRRQVLSLAREIKNSSGVFRAPLLDLELAEAAREGDLARAAELHTEIRQQNEGNVFERLTGHATVLMAAGRYREVLSLEERHRGELKRFEQLLLRVGAEERLRVPTLRGTLDQLSLLADNISLPQNVVRDTVPERAALELEDEAMLKALPTRPGFELERAWYLAVLRRDAGAEAAVFRQAAADNGPHARRLQLEALAREGKFEAIAREAAAFRAGSTSVVLEGEFRVLEAWALWQLGRREEACRVLTWESLLQPLLRHERERVQPLVRECPHLGLSALPASALDLP